MNGRLNLILTQRTDFIYEHDVLFISETHTTLKSLPKIDGYQKFADPEIEERSRGGIALYVRNHLTKEVCNIMYDECFITFKLKESPSFLFIGVYIPPEGSRYEDIGAFARLSILLKDCQKKKITPFIGGDFNSRPGNLKDLPLQWNYNENSDKNTNSYGETYFHDLCTVGRVMPVNHLIYNGKEFPGNFTYVKSDKRSQIDFVLTSSVGREYVEDYGIIENDWHLSDHRPIMLVLLISKSVNISSILPRAIELNESDEKQNISRFNGNYNYDIIEQYLVDHSDSIQEALQHEPRPPDSVSECLSARCTQATRS